MWAGSLASIRGKTWPWVAGHFATLEVSACQMPRHVPAGEGGVRGFTLTGALLKMTDWRLAPSALILAPLGLTKTFQFSLRRGWNVSYFNLTCTNGPGSCYSSTWKTSKKYRHWETASFLNPTRNIKVFKPFYGSLCVSLLKDGLESVQNPKPFSEHRLRSTPLCLLLVPSSASKPPKNVGYWSKIFPRKRHLVFCKRTLWSPPWTTGLKKWTRNEGLLVASALNGLLSVLTGSEDSGVNALKQHRQYKY